MSARAGGRRAAGRRARARRRLRSGAHAVARLWFGGLFYRHSLKGAVPRALPFVPREETAGSAGEGRAILDGRARFLDAAAAPRVRGAAMRAAEADLVRYHGFDWLADLEAAGGAAARERAAALIAAWIDRNARWHPVSWRPDVLSRRVCNWLVHATFAAGGGGEGFPRLFLDSLARQVRHLRRVRPFVEHDLGRLTASKALVYAALSLPGGARDVPGLLRQLLGSCSAQLLPDGGHVRRDPEAQLDALRLLADVRDAVRDAGLAAPGELQETISRVAAVAGLFRHGDGGLAVFAGSGEGDPDRIAALLVRAAGSVEPLVSARSTGFERVATQRGLLVVDCGLPQARAAGTLAFEFSVGPQRIVVNCGARERRGGAWRGAFGATAAHSTLVVEDTNSSVLRPDGSLAQGPGRVTCRRSERDGQVWLDTSHDGYASRLGLVHRRRFHMNSAGTELRGEDSLTGSGARRFDIRFHLHPTVRASALRDGTTVLLQLPDRVGWRLLCRGGTARLEESLYLAAPGETRRSEQVVISGSTRDGAAVVNWALTELSRR